MQTEIDREAAEARKVLVRVHISQLPAWHGARPETASPLRDGDMSIVHTETHIGYVYNLATNGQAFTEYRSTPASRPGRRHVYGCTASGDIEFAGHMDSLKELKRENGKLRKAELQRLRHRTAPSWDGRRGRR